MDILWLRPVGWLGTYQRGGSTRAKAPPNVLNRHAWLQIDMSPATAQQHHVNQHGRHDVPRRATCIRFVCSNMFQPAQNTIEHIDLVHPCNLDRRKT